MYTEKIQVSLTPDQLSMLDRVVEYYGTTRSAFVRRAVCDTIIARGNGGDDPVLIEAIVGDRDIRILP